MTQQGLSRVDALAAKDVADGDAVAALTFATEHEAAGGAAAAAEAAGAAKIVSRAFPLKDAEAAFRFAESWSREAEMVAYDCKQQGGAAIVVLALRDLPANDNRLQNLTLWNKFAVTYQQRYGTSAAAIKCIVTGGFDPQNSKRAEKATWFAARSKHSSVFSVPSLDSVAALPNGDSVPVWRFRRLLSLLGMDKALTLTPGQNSIVKAPSANTHAYPSFIIEYKLNNS